MKGVYRRGNRWWLRFTWQGKRHFVNLHESDEARAIERARQILNAPAIHLEGPPEIHRLLREFGDLKRARGISARWVEDERMTIEGFLAEARVTHPDQITAARIQPWIDRHWKRNERTADAYLARVGRFCKWLQARGHLLRNPVETMPRLRPKPRVRRRFLRKDEARRLIDACDDPDLKLCLYLALHAGLRKQECLMARWNWVDLDSQLLHVQGDEHWHPKDRDDRTIPLTEEFAEVLDNFRNGQNNFLVKPEAPPGRWRYRWEFRKPFNDLARRCGFEDLWFHDLRRTFASLHVSAGTSIYKVARWMGDGVAVVENHYGHLVPCDDEINRAWN